MYLNLRSTERPRYVYRIMSVTRLFQMFQDSANYLVRPWMWEDPFENFISHLKGQLPSGELVEFAQRYDFFGQCWTLLGAGSDAMWRIYSRDKRSVRVKVSIDDLHASLACTACGVPFIGRVRYLKGNELFRWTGRVVRATKQPSLELLAKTFLVKRMAFAHENEVRLLYCGTENETSVLYRYPLDCHRTVRELMLDPRLTQKEFLLLRDEIKCKTSYAGQIIQSTLYAPPTDFALRLGERYATLPRRRGRVSYDGDRRIRTCDDGPDQLVFPLSPKGR